jgi:hypothetical protein
VIWCHVEQVSTATTMTTARIGQAPSGARTRRLRWTTLSPVSPQTNDAHDAITGRLSSSIEVRKYERVMLLADGMRQTLFSDRKFYPSLSCPVVERTAKSMNRDSGVQPVKQNAHRHRAERPSSSDREYPARSLA